ncbi:MAG: alpha/beta hydrolase, partial [Thiohalorhabdaceae bacterium]
DELVLNPGTLGLAYEEVRIDDGKGPVLKGWYLPAESDRVAGSVLFLHGNAQNVSNHLLSVDWLPERGFNVLLIDYRGYGASEGVATLSGAATDARRALAYLAEREDEGIPLAVLGQSLGGGLAPYAVSGSPYRPRVEAVILDSAFAGFRRIAREKLDAFWLTWPLQVPLSWTISNGYSGVRHVADLSPIPVLVIHGEADRVVPAEHGRSLFAAAREPKALWLVPEAGHIQALRRDKIRDRFAQYLWDRLGGPGSQPPASPDGAGFHIDIR